MAADYIYLKSVNQPVPPTGGERVEDHASGGWTRTPPEPTLTESVWRAERQRTYKWKIFQSATAWDDVIWISYLSEEKDYIYKKSADEPSAPAGGAGTKDHQPDGWQRTPPEPTLAEPVWRAERTETFKRTRKSAGSGYDEEFQSATAWSNVTKYCYLSEETDSVYKKSATQPPVPTGGANDKAYTPPGWTRTASAPTLTKPVWRAQRTLTYKHTLKSDGTYSGAFQSAKVWTVEMYCYLTQGTDYVYKKSATKPTAPTGGTNSETHTPSGWQRSTLAATLTEPVWRAERTLTYKHTRKSTGAGYDKAFQPPATAWGSVVKYCYYHLSEEKDYIYKRSATQPPAPTGGTNRKTYTPPGWQRKIPEPTLAEPVWRAQRTLIFKRTLKSDGSGDYDEMFHSATAWGSMVKYCYLNEEQDHVYKKSAAKPTTPTGGTNSETHTPSGWSRTKSTPTLTEPVWRAERTLTYKHTLKSDGSSHDKAFQPPATAWGGMVKISSDTDYIYKLSAAAPAVPSGGADSKDHRPSGWLRTKPNPTATQNLYQATRTRHYEGDEFEKATSWGNVAKIGDKLTVDAGGPYYGLTKRGRFHIRPLNLAIPAFSARF